MPLLDTLTSALGSPWSQANESLILAPYTYTVSKPGKEMLKLFLEAFNIWLAVPHEQLNAIEHISQMLHSASLMIDDIEDDGEVRRGQPAAHVVYGIAQTINSANYVYFLAYKELANLKELGGDRVATKDVETVVTEELLNVHRGQGLEILWRDLLHCPTEEEYVSMVNNKTSACFRMAIRLMMAYASKNRDVDFVPLVNIFGLYYQIRDDYMNLQSTQYTQNKGFAEDLTEGKFSFPIIHGVCADDGNHFITSILRKRSPAPTMKRLAIEHLLVKTNSFDYTLAVMDSLERQVQEKITSFGGNPLLDKIVDALHVDVGLMGPGSGGGGCPSAGEHA